MSQRVVTIVLALLTIVLGGAGFVLGLNGFGANILAELAGVALSVLIAYTLVEALLRNQRTQQWRRVRTAVRGALATRVQSVAFDFYLVDSAPQSWLKASTPEEIASSLDAMAAHIYASRERLSQQGQDEMATSRELHRETSADIAFIRDVLAARVFLMADDAELAEALIALDDAERRWWEGIRLIYDDWGYPNDLAWERAAETAQALARLYRIVAIDD